MNQFTKIIKSRGWKVKDACKHWDIAIETYYRMSKRPKQHNALECMCCGLEDKTIEEDG